MIEIRTDTRAALDDRHYFPTPPRVEGYVPRQLSTFESQIEACWRQGASLAAIEEEVKELVDGWVRSLADTDFLREDEVDTLVKGAQQVASSRILDHNDAPFAVVEEVRAFLVSKKLID
jgi:hypothetical protein